MNYKIIFNFAIKLIGLYYLIMSITNFELSLSIILSNLVDTNGQYDNYNTNIAHIIFTITHFIMNLFIILRSEKILDLIYKNNKTDLDIIADTHNTTTIDNSNLLNLFNASVILIGFILFISNIADLILSIKDYYNAMLKFGGINADLTNVTFHGKPALIKSILGVMIIIFQNKISYWLTNKITIENLKSIK